MCLLASNRRAFLVSLTKSLSYAKKVFFYFQWVTVSFKQSLLGDPIETNNKIELLWNPKNLKLRLRTVVRTDLTLYPAPEAAQTSIRLITGASVPSGTIWDEAHKRGNSYKERNDGEFKWMIHLKAFLSYNLKSLNQKLWFDQIWMGQLTDYAALAVLCVVDWPAWVTQAAGRIVSLVLQTNIMLAVTAWLVRKVINVRFLRR